MQSKEGGGGGKGAINFNPVQVDLQWIRRVQKEERILMDGVNGDGSGKNSNPIDDVYQHFGSAYFY